MSYDYTGFQNQVALMLAVPPNSSLLASLLPGMIDYAEQRIYRELDILNTRMVDSSSVTSAGSRFVTLPDTLVVDDTLGVITPADTNAPSGTLNLCTRVTHDFIDNCFPSNSAPYLGTPRYYAMSGQQQAMLGPCPDGAYTVQVYGTYRPEPLSATNTTTPLTVLLPDLFMAAAMIWGSLYQRNFAAAGTTSDSAAMGASYEKTYAELMTWAKSEEFRKKYQSSSWTSRQTAPTADRQRG